VDVSQKRLCLNPKDAAAQEQTWVLPVCIKTSGDQPDCPVVNAATQQLQAPGAPVFYGNAGGKGYYRSRYDKADYQQLLRQVETNLTPSERITFLGSQWALARAGISPVGDFLNLAAAVRDDNSSFVITTVSGALRIIDQQVASTPEEHKELAAWVRQNFATAFARLGAPVSGEAPDKSLLRAALFGLLGNIGSDPAIIADARKVAEQYLSNPASVDPTLAATALNVAAQNGDATFFDELQRVSRTSGDPQLRSQAFHALASFRDEAMVVRALDYALSGQVKNQDALRLVQLEMRDRRTRDATWQYVQQNWPRVRAQVTTWMGGELVESMGGFCSTDRSSQVSEFFAAHSVSATSHALDKARDSIADCVDLRLAQGPNLKQWLQTEATDTR
jgi:aminopeptidase N